MQTKPLNEIIVECIEYSNQVDFYNQYYPRFFYNPKYYISSYDLLKHNSNNLKYKERIAILQLFKRYMNVNRFKV